MKSNPIVIFWFRRDLRLDDNAALYHALKSGYRVMPVFIFDTDILKQFETPENAQVEFIHQQLQILQKELGHCGSSLKTGHSTPAVFFENLCKEHTIKAVYANEDYELSARERDADIESLLKEKDIDFLSFKDQVIFSKDDIVKDDRTPYTVFTPYSKRWKQHLQPGYLESFDNRDLFCNFYQYKSDIIPSLSDLGFSKKRGISFPPMEFNGDLIRNYTQQRDYPSIEGTSRLGIHLRFGTISIRQLVAKAQAVNETFLNELIWREFYHAITWHFPHICKGQAFKPQYDEIVWRNDETEFKAWSEGKTGYPIVDAGMRQLNDTGFMHNRVRMITASFLIKHLLIDWRWGEAYFANKLLDFDFAANNGGWQWASSSGCDAVPYFRIFNPQLQTEKFDKHLEYIKKWIPDFDPLNYIPPIVNHESARKRALETYSNALKK
ncbi:deoxyribodipyrimidine photo-lyase [Dysgonomonas alginatilytica]|uniref:Deoxyribodipyrimidine photo-lyase n=1 Tax=Dysgonomonas alginatilytica TaxID=1605892 RepID=A0A2V3PMU0_9BACT|nr:deoxyribodipyrimidine photo-lyase [Dysgonomonas alginatilytica]PXV63343.1 deoxyribodipyrimidine photo-lyase [Dysgonomonas alginatilytica]